jgi:hypothetical protein
MRFAVDYRITNDHRRPAALRGLASARGAGGVEHSGPEYSEVVPSSNGTHPVYGLISSG